jgi:hypothetical protein
MGNVRTVREYEEFQKTGTTIDTDVAVLTLDCRRMDELCILIKNTGSTNGLDYTIVSYAKYGGDLSNTETSATQIAAAATVQKIYTAKNFAEIIVYIKAHTGSAQTTYEVEAIQKG